jgi:hypothetical protein
MIVFKCEGCGDTSEIINVLCGCGLIQKPVLIAQKAPVAEVPCGDGLCADHQKIEMLVTELQKILKVVADSDAWWMDCPDRGGIDTEAIESVLRKVSA